MGAKAYENDRRWYPRIEIERDVTLVGEDHGKVVTRIQNVSPGGLKLCCDRATAHALHPSGRYIKADTGPRFYARFTLPVAGNEASLETGCRMVYLEVLADQTIAIGLEFTRFVGESEALLERFIAAAIEPV